MRVQTRRLLLGIAGMVCVGWTSALAGTATYDFNAAPPADLNYVGNAEWRDTGGNPGGYLALFDSVNSQHASIIIPDFDTGMVVKAFTLECDLRIGNPVGNSGRPADGFSISYARANDPVVVDLTQEPPVDNLNSFSIPGAPEGGCTTGLSVVFDTWSGNVWPSGETDIEGIILRVDNATKARVPMTTRNGGCTDATSLQTGPWDPANTGTTDGLCWAKLKVELNDAGEVTVTWKGTVIVNKVATGFSPSAGRIVFAGRTGGANENTHVDNLKVTTVPADKALISGVTANAAGYTVMLSDSGGSTVVDGSVKLKIDDAAVALSSFDHTGPISTAKVDVSPNWLVSQSVHKVDIEFNESQGTTIKGTRNVTVQQYTTVTPALKVTGVSTADRGFLVRTHQVERGLNNSNERADQQLFGELGDNVADLTPFTQTVAGTTEKYYVEQSFIDYEQNGTPAGNFQAETMAMPGIPGNRTSGDATDMVAIEALGFVDFPAAGLYTLGGNSDDGFRVTFGKNPFDRFQLDAATDANWQFNGGRGASDSTFTLLVAAAGIYPMRLTFEEGTGGNSIELFSVLADGTKVLVNDTAGNPQALKVYWRGPMTDRAYISKVRPGVRPSTTGDSPTPGILAARDAKVEITIKNASTSVVGGSVKMQFDDADVTPTVTTAAGTTTVTYDPPGLMDFGSTHKVKLMYDETTTPQSTRTVTFNFDVKAIGVEDIGPSFWIEAEDFDYDGGSHMADASVMPYAGGAYDGLGAVHDVDHHRAYNDGSSDLYRIGENNQPMDPQTAAGTLDVQRPGPDGVYEVTTNYKLGWLGGGHWFNFTRLNIDAGLYTAYSANSHGNPGTRVGVDIGLVTEGVGTTTQTVVPLATCRGYSAGGWGDNVLCPAVTPTGAQGVFKLPAGKKTLRTTTYDGDFDWWMLVKVSGVPPAVTSLPLDSVKRNEVILDWTLTDYSTAVKAGSVKLFLDGVDKTSKAVITKTADGATVHLDDAGTLYDAGIHPWKITFDDTSTPPKPISAEGTVLVNPYPTPGTFTIEAEDFNYDGGLTNPQAGTAGLDVDVMPYHGNAYNGLGATEGIDYNNNDGNESDQYRTEKDPNGENEVNIVDANGNRYSNDRGVFDVTTNFRIGWVEGGSWQNYTRTLPSPAKDYAVWAALSFDGRGAGQLNGSLDRVTSDPKQGGQTTERLGTFNWPGSAGWGRNELVPMKDGAGNMPAVVNLGGTLTLRFNLGSGDLDYLLLVPLGAAPPPSVGPITVSGGNINVPFTGTLYSTTSLAPPISWSPAATVSPYTSPASGVARYFQSRQ